MFVATAVSHMLLAAALVFTAIRKLSRRADIVEGYQRVGVPERRLAPLAILLLVSASGLIVGLVVAPVGIATSAGLVAYFLLAIVAHLRARDAAHVATPVAIELLAVTALVLRFATL